MNWHCSSDFFLCDIETSVKHSAVKIAGQEFEYTIYAEKNTLVTIRRENKDYPCIVMADSSGNVTVSYAGYAYPVEVFTETEQKFRRLLQSSAVLQNQYAKVSAPMPGLITNIVVQLGQRVKKGETMLVLEAMKMENSLKAPVTGTITEITTSIGTAVDKNDNLCIITL